MMRAGGRSRSPARARPGRHVALAPGRTAFIDFPGGPGTVPEIPAVTVLHRTSPTAALRGRIVVIGVTAASIGDQHSVAAGGGALMSGPELEADAILTAIANFPLRPAPAWLEGLLIALSATLVPAIALQRSASLASVAAFAWLIVGAAVAQFAFDDGAVVEVIAPLCAVIVSTAGVNAVDLVTVRRGRARLEATFARYVPAEHARRIADLVESGRGLADELEATVMFCDLRGWTGIAERTAPAALLSELNRYLGQVSDAVMDHGGSVVTFLGDGVMAVFGAPLPSDDHAERALAAAREILGAVGRDRIGIGLATGPVVSGTVGSGRRLEYAAIGDTTNVAARVQSMTRAIGRPLLLTAATYERLPDAERARLEYAGTHPVRGRDAGLELWTVS
jgi:adenylate cyclase